MADKLMTLNEKLAVGVKVAALYDEGKDEEASRLLKTTPLAPWLAKILKEKWGAIEWLKNSGWNMSEVEAEFGHGWLDK